MSGIDVEAVTFARSEVTVCDAVSLHASPGEVVIIVGPNGAGKSTLLGLVAGDLVPKHGRVLINGNDVHKTSPRALSRIRSVMPQHHEVYFAFSVAEIVAMGCASLPMSPASMDDLVARCLAEVEMSQMAHRPVTSLSGGEIARVAFARVLSQSTSVVLLDEPTSALDVRHQEKLMTNVCKLADSDVTVMMVTHDLNLAGTYADRIVVMKDGDVVIDDVPEVALTPEILSSVYGYPMSVHTDVNGRINISPLRSGQTRASMGKKPRNTTIERTSL